jgi:universal stress protein A
MSIYKRILLATDFSDINRAALKRAGKLAKLNDCELVVLYVIEHFPLDGGPLSSELFYKKEPDESMTRHIKAKLDELVSDLEHEKVTTVFRITSSSARHEILRFAKAHAVDLIVVAPHGHGVIGSLGSTATGVLNNAVCDVLAVREPEAPENLPG